MSAIPSTGQLVILRNRPARVTDVQAHSGDRGVYHAVEVRYCDGWFYPETESIIWELEPRKQIQSSLSLPELDKPSLAPDHPDIFDAYLHTLRWTNHTSILQGEDTDLLSPWFGAIQVEDYQLYPVWKSLQMPRVSLLLGDDVGLGKTIQAGMILTELLRRRKIRKVLILCPASLQTQWQEEMAEKFQIQFSILDRNESNKLFRSLGMDTNPWKVRQRIITSMDYLRQPDILDQFLAAAEASLHEGLPTMPWDLLIVDEAHNITPAGFGQETQRFKMMEQISRFFEHRLFLTATPHSGYTWSYTKLLSLLDPVRFSPKAELTDNDHASIKKVMVRRLKSELNQDTDPPRFPDREVKAVPVVFGDAELCLFEALGNYRKKALEMLAHRSRRDRNLGKFMFTLLTKRLLSSSYAFARTWWQHVEGVDLTEEVGADLFEQVQKRATAEINDDEERRHREEDAVRYGAAWLRLFTSHETSQLESLRLEVNQALNDLGWNDEAIRTPFEDLYTLPDDGRWIALTEWIEDYLKQDGGFRVNERLILFTEYLDTLKYLQRRFELDGIIAPILQVLYGGAPQDIRDLIKREFNTSDSPLRILLGTDTASEGLNFQYQCRYVFHQDIPWNPARLEQRNGRVDRHNQARDAFVFHYTTGQQADLEFLGRVLRKVNQVREDLGSMGQVFDEAIERTFAPDGSIVSDEELDRRLEELRSRSPEREDTNARDKGTGSDYQQAVKAFERTQERLDISPETLAHIFSQGMRLAGGDVEQVEPGIFRITAPPPEFSELIDDTLVLSSGRMQGALPKIAFDTTEFETVINGRKIYRTKPDTILMRLNHPLMKRILGFFEKHMWGEDTDKIRRWTVVKSPGTVGIVFSLSCLLQCTNELREILHSEILNLHFTRKNGKLATVDSAPDPVSPMTNQEVSQIRQKIAEIWMDTKDEVLTYLGEYRDREKARLESQVQKDAEESLKREQGAFTNRKRFLKSQRDVRSLERERKIIEELESSLKQGALFIEDMEAIERELKEKRWDLEERGRTINSMLDYIEREEKRTLNEILPKRYSIAHMDLQPVAVKVIIGEADG